MSYYGTIEEDLARARQILTRGQVEPPDLSIGEHVNFGGTIYGGDLFAAYKLLESFVTELTNFLQLFSDYEEPCEGYDHALAIWNGMKERESRLHEETPLMNASNDDDPRLTQALAENERLHRVIAAMRTASQEIITILDQVEPKLGRILGEETGLATSLSALASILASVEKDARKPEGNR